MVLYGHFSRLEVTKMPTQHQVSALLTQLEAQMSALQLWQTNSPSIAALSSDQPFAIDTLEPNEWLQWIFIVRINVLIEQKQPLPSGFEILPYFEQAWQNQPEMETLLMTIAQLDKAFNPC